MITIVLIIIALIVYVLSAYKAYKFFKIAFSEKGMWYGQYPGIAELFFVFCPFENTIFMIITFFQSPYENPPAPKRHFNLKIDSSKFFNIKK